MPHLSIGCGGGKSQDSLVNRVENHEIQLVTGKHRKIVLIKGDFNFNQTISKYFF